MAEPSQAGSRGAPRATLLETTAHDGLEPDRCMELLAESAGERNVLAVLLTGTVDAWLDRWRTTTDARPPQLGIITANDRVRSAAGGERAGTPISLAPDVAVRPLSHPGDLTGLEIAIASFLDEWSLAARGTTICVDSLTVLLQCVTRRAAFRFLNTLTSQAWQADADVHAHLDPSTVDERTRATMTSLFDTVVAPGD